MTETGNQVPGTDEPMPDRLKFHAQTERLC